MRLFAIGDLHLAGGDNKPMDVFGPQWDRHFEKISENWRNLVREEDTVLIPGDISWANRLEEALPDLEMIGALPGKKILIKGNHDYWWNSITQVRSVLPSSMAALQHNAADLGDTVVCGTRGWMIPTAAQPLELQDRKIYEREAQRLKMALEEAQHMAKERPILAVMHYPPLLSGEHENLFTELLEQYHVFHTIYGHLHGAGIQSGFTGEFRGVQYTLVSCDSIGFSPKLIPLPEE